MNSISFFSRKRDGVRTVVGDFQSILDIANILEEQKIEFKVAFVPGVYLKQEDMGTGGFLHWLEPNASW